MATANHLEATPTGFANGEVGTVLKVTGGVRYDNHSEYGSEISGRAGLTSRWSKTVVAKLLYGTPHVVTAHSLEPLRPWKAEQLGPGYALSRAFWFKVSMSHSVCVNRSPGTRTLFVASP